MGSTMDDRKITIIEGPTPTFEVVYDNWANGIVDGASLASVAVTRLRTANGHSARRALLPRLEPQGTDSLRVPGE